jgi:hypothetical protein
MSGSAILRLDPLLGVVSYQRVECPRPKVVQNWIRPGVNDVKSCPKSTDLG